jgi:CheY-like chemotaxis protein
VSYSVIVADEAGVRRLVVEPLTAAGYRVAAAGAGRAALAVLQQPGPPPCVAFMDHMLGDPRLAKIPVIMFSAGHRVQAQADFLAKPFGTRAVLMVAQHSCGQQS